MISGESYIDTSALTGESVPRRIKEKDIVLSGCINMEGTIRVRTIKEFEDSTVSKILDLVENAASRKAKAENFITRFAKHYTPVVTLLAVALAVIPTLLGMGAFSMWLERACIFLVISCPCALVISVPLGFFAGIGKASRIGVLVKGSNYLEELSYVTSMVFDKTGTITKGEFEVTEIICVEGKKDEILTMAAIAEEYSNHPIAMSIKKAYEKYVGGKPDFSGVGESKNFPGKGVLVNINGKNVLVGNRRLLEENKIGFSKFDRVGTHVHVAVDGVYLGVIIISDKIKDGVKEALSDLKYMGVTSLVMLTGDGKEASDAVSAEAGMDEVYSNLLPADKVSSLEKIISKSKGKVAFVGDGINDAPVLSRADIGIAMGSMGSDAAIEAADIVLMDDDISKIGRVMRISKKTVCIVRENIVFSLAVKLAILILGALGVANMWEAVFADVGVCVIAILNSMRMLYKEL